MLYGNKQQQKNNKKQKKMKGKKDKMALFIRWFDCIMNIRLNNTIHA